jgi:cytochrome P450
MSPDVPDDCRPYMRTMSERNGPEHTRLRRLVAPAFGTRRAAGLRPRVAAIVARLLDDLPADRPVDLLEHFARPLPMDVICELVGVPEADRPSWRTYGATVASGAGAGFAAAIPGIMDGAKRAIARGRADPGDDVIGDLVRTRSEDGDRLSDTELVTLVWHLVIAGQTPTNLIANAVAALLAHPGQLAELRADPGLMPGAVDELIRWCGPTLMTIPRYAREDTDLHGVAVRAGDAVTTVVAAANRDPRAYDDPDRLDIHREMNPGHLGFAHGVHYCLGASLARVQTEVALNAVLYRFPDLELAADPGEIRAVDPGTWRLTSLPVTG